MVREFKPAEFHATCYKILSPKPNVFAKKGASHEESCPRNMSPFVFHSLYFTYLVGVGLGRIAVERSLHTTGSHARSPRVTSQLSQTCRSTGTAVGTGYMLLCVCLETEREWNWCVGGGGRGARKT